MNAHLDSHRIQIGAHQARIAETAPPAHARSGANPVWRRATATIAAAVVRSGSLARRVLTRPEPGPVTGAAPAMLGRHPHPSTAPPCR